MQSGKNEGSVPGQLGPTILERVGKKRMSGTGETKQGVGAIGALAEDKRKEERGGEGGHRGLLVSSCGCDKYRDQKPCKGRKGTAGVTHCVQGQQDVGHKGSLLAGTDSFRSVFVSHRH